MRVLPAAPVHHSWVCCMAGAGGGEAAGSTDQLTQLVMRACKQACHLFRLDDKRDCSCTTAANSMMLLLKNQKVMHLAAQWRGRSTPAAPGRRQRGGAATHPPSDRVEGAKPLSA